jgi:hypothetical protein
MSTDSQNKLRSLEILVAYILVASLVFVFLVAPIPTLAQDLIIDPPGDGGGDGGIDQGGISGTYTDTWWQGFTGGEFDETTSSEPVVVAYSVGQMDPEFYDQTISVQTSLSTESGRTTSSGSSGYSSASVMVTMPLVYDESTQNYEIGNYTVFTTYNSVTGTFTTTGLGAGAIGISLSCYNLTWDNVALHVGTYKRAEPCNTACGSAGDTLTFRYNPARGTGFAPWVVVVAEPYTKLLGIKLCSHVFTARRLVVGPCACGNIEAPIFIDPTLPIPHFDESCSSAFANKCMMYGGDFDFETCTCLGCAECGGSPILIDVKGDGFRLTAASAGVSFDLEANRLPQRWSWTVENSDDAWLVLDRNSNGTIDDGSELFGNFTHQPISDTPNGFKALAEFDSFARGGNGDGVIDQNDAIYSSLRLWQDSNHNGVSEANELHTLSELGVKTVELDYKLSKKTDEFGNRFKYRAKVKDSKGEQLGRWAWDVFLVSQ